MGPVKKQDPIPIIKGTEKNLMINDKKGSATCGCRWTCISNFEKMAHNCTIYCHVSSGKFYILCLT